MKGWAAVAAFAVAALGAGVILGWHLQLPMVVQVHADYVPMQYNTALGFVLVGVALGGMLRGHARVASTAAIVVAALAVLTLFQYLSGVSLGIDELLMTHEITVQSSDPGRMAPNTAVGFLLIGLAIRRAAVSGSQAGSAVAAILAAIVFSLALVACVGYLLQIPTAYGWGQLTRMALHSSLGFMLASSALIAWNWQRANQRLPSWSPTLLAITASTTSVVFCQSIAAQQDAKLQVEANGFQIVLQQRLWELQTALQRMAERHERAMAMRSVTGWEADADAYRRDFPAIQGITLVASDGSLLRSSPPEYRLGLLQGCCGRPITESEPVAASAVDSQGKFLIVHGLRQEGQLAGLLVASCDFPRFIKGTPSLLDSFSVQLAHPSDKRLAGFDRILTLANASYPLHMDPVPGHGSPRNAAVAVLIAGLGVSGLLYWLVTSRQKIAQINLQLSAALRQTQHANDQFEQQHVKLNETMHTLQLYAGSLDRSNQELQQFAYVAAHDLRSPLRGLSHLTRFISEDVAEAGATLPESVHQYISELDAQVQRMQGLLSGLLDYSRVGREEQPASKVDLKKLVDDAVAMADVPANFQVTKPTQYPALYAPPNALSRVLQNLIDNAVKHHDKPHGRISIEVEEQDNAVILEISDDGPGIPANAREKVFQIFQTLKPKTQKSNSGIGLAIVRKLVIDLGGTIEIVDSPWGGARFRIHWPKKTAERVNPAALWPANR